MWIVPLALLGAKAGGQVVVSVMPTSDWTEVHRLRVLYLHVMLLGFVTLGLASAANYILGMHHRMSIAALNTGFVMVLASLVLLTPFIRLDVPAFAIAAWISPLPVAAAAWMLFERSSSCSRKRLDPDVESFNVSRHVLQRH